MTPKAMEAKAEIADEIIALNASIIAGKPKAEDLPF